ncbi:hypothetical protein GCM10007103_29170 [Salinimicrobium marinum]|uniref:O-antigen ligase-related domain-containing protein n=1 Tax=Salinimicrobium marinum TaxID=680283 RepID=A0A918W0R1_9FLAO|nr:O-antigen ligase family protein [Salinimicrobium marinum]GHA46227.1 hypothetical protein GCM10007103_29170 [Salinimicrobium marinum]
MVSKERLQEFGLFFYLFAINFEVYDPFNSGFLSIAKIAAGFYLFTVLPDLNKFLFVDNIAKYLKPKVLLLFSMTIMSLINFDSYSLPSSLFDFTFALNIIIWIILINHERLSPGIIKRGLLFFILGSIILTLFYHLNIGVRYEGGRVTILGDNQNAIGSRISISILIIIFSVYTWWVSGKKVFALMLLTSIPLMLSLMLETGSRKAVIALVLSFIIGIIFLRTKKNSHKILIILIACFCTLYFISMLSGSEILMKRLLATAEDGDLAGRDRIWTAILPVIFENPFFGVGQTGFYQFSKETFGAYNSPHNVILEVLAYTGILGLILYLNFLIKVIRTTIQNYSINKDILPLLLLIPVFGFILGGQALGSKISWVIFAFAVSRIFYFIPKMEKIE